MHPVTKKINPAEDFKPNLQEVDFRNMLKAQWKASAKDKKVRTMVLNGDNFEFMQTTRTTENQQFKGKHDKYGPLNTPENVVAKLVNYDPVRGLQKVNVLETVKEAQVR